MKIGTNQAQLRKMARDNANKMVDGEFFGSKAFENFLQTIVNGITKRFERPVQIVIHNDQNSGETASTNNSVVNVNISGPELPGLSRSDRFTALKGLVTHECGHILFTDFKLNQKAGDELYNNGLLYPTPSCTREYKNWQDLLDKCNYSTRMTLFSLYNTFNNCVEDGNIEKQVCEVYLGAAKDLHFVRSIYQASTPDLSKYEQVPAILSAANQIAVYGQVKGTHPDELVNEIIAKLRPYIRAAVNEDNAEKRLNLINDAYVLLINACIDLLKKEDPDNSQQQKAENKRTGSENQQGQGSNNPQQQGNDSQNNQSMNSQSQQSQGQGRENGTNNSDACKTPLDSKTVEKMENQLSQATSDQNQAPVGNRAAAPVGTTKAIKDKKTDRTQQKYPTEQENGKDETSQKEMQQILNSAAMDKAKGQFEKKLAKNLQIEGSMCKQSTLSEYPMKMHRAKADLNRWQEYLLSDMDKAVKPYSKRIQRDLQRILTDMQQGDIKRGLFMGRKFDSSRAYRQDGRKMASRKAPTDAPDLAVMLLVDQSGSMGGERINAARLASYLVYDFCTGMDIPVSIYGHEESNMNGGKVHLYSYAEFDSVDGKDKCRIAKMETGACNRDGYAIRYAAQHLEKRPEKMKILIIISDGQPNGYEYKGEAAAQDVRRAVAEAKKAGITEVFTAGIGESRKKIREVYVNPEKPGKSAKFLDITDLSKMPKLFVNLVREAMDVD